MSAQNTLLTAVSAAEIGAFDYIPKPFDLDDMTAAARRALARPADSEAARAQARADARRAPAADRPLGADAGGLPHHRAAGRRRPDRADPGRIRRRQGTGRARPARPRPPPRRPFVAINLAAVPRERVETELFGKGDGDFGKLVEADGGTLFLDEIGDMPLDAQTRLLRVFDGAEPAINPRTGRRPNVRVIAATNRDLRGLIRAGPVPRGPLLPPQRRAGAPAAAARAHRGHPRPRPRLPAARQPRGPAGQDHRRRRPGAAEDATTGPATCASWRT